MQRSVYYYKSVKSDQAFLKQRIKEIAYSRIHYGYRRIHIVLLREGFHLGRKTVLKLYQELNLQMRRCKPKRRVQVKPRLEDTPITKKNDVWAIDFVADFLTTGECLKILTVVDLYTRESPIIGVKFSYKAEDVIFSLEEGIILHGFPKMIRLDNGPEFISKALDIWAYKYGIIFDFTRPGKPTDNAYIESFNSRLRQECLNQHWFLN